MYKHAILIVLLLLSFLVIPTQPVSAQDAGGHIYIVQAGDSLSSIASDLNISPEDLIAANNITDPNMLVVGQQLIIPDITRINIGDTYHIILRHKQISANVFQKMNHLLSPGELYIGKPIITLQPQTMTQLAGMTRTKGETLLESAVKHNSDVWTLAEINGLQGSWGGLPGDTLFTPGGDDAQNTSNLPPAFISARIRDLPLKQGSTGVILVQTIPGVSLNGLFVDQSLLFFPMADGTQVALQGIHAMIAPGVYPLKIEATLPDGTTQSFEQSVIVQSGNYPTDPLLSVSSETINPATNDAEAQQLDQLTSPVTPTRYWQGGFTNPSPDFLNCHPSFFGDRRNYVGQGTNETYHSFHSGLDFCGQVGSPITATADGVVIFTGMLTVHGNTTIIDHGWGIYSMYCHQSVINVQTGQLVKAGDLIGRVGETGRVTGPHLHWEVWANGIQVDPLDWLKQPYP